MRLIGLAGWSGSGKTTLLTRLIPVLTARGLRVSTVKHAHHEFDVDVPGKDSWRHREAGAAELEELRDEAEPPLAELLPRLAPVDLVIVEGWKREAHPRIEVFRRANGKPPLHPDDAGIVAVASDTAFPGAGVPVVPLDDVPAVAALVLSCGAPLRSAGQGTSRR